MKGIKILIAYDGSESSKHALNQGVSLAKLTDSDVTILSVIPRITMPLLPAEGAGVSPASIAQTSPEFQQEMKKFYTESLEKVAEGVEEKYPNIDVVTKLMEGRPSSIIVEISEEGNYDLIVIGSRGLGGISGLILGSTSRRVVETCTIPVLVVK